MSDADTLSEIRDSFRDDTAEWRDIREHGSRCMRAIAGDPWTAKDRKLRVDANRPCLSLDELSQYVNQVDNDLRQNKRGIKVSQVGNGATDKTATFRQGLIRQIEYRSNAQQAYSTMAQNAIQRGYGALRIKPRYVDESGPTQELIIDPIVNPDMLTVDPYALRPDGADMRRATFHESLSKKEFKREYRGASIQDFSFDESMMSELTQWISSERVTVAEHWRKELAKQRRRLWLKAGGRSAENPNGEPIERWEDELNGRPPSSDQIMHARDIDTYKVVQYVTNGVEILKRADWPGKSIPFVTMYGKVLFVDEGNGTKRKLLSLVSLALEPYMLYCYYRTCEAELVGMTPKFPYFVYRGQLNPDELVELQKSLHEPIAVIQVEPMIDGAGGGVLGMPQRQPYEPPLVGLEAGAEGARRAIQAAIGMGFLPTQAQRHNEKSGIALQQIKESGQLGSFHFSDHYNESVTRTGQILDENIPFYYDTARDVTVRDDKDEVQVVRINDPQAMNKEGHPEHIDATAGDHDVTISVGPAMASEREANSAFADSIVSNPQIAQAVGPQKYAELLAAAIRLKGVGPIGDEMAEIISPKPKDGDMDPKQMQAQLQQAMQMGQEMQQKLQEAGQIIQTKQVESQTKKDIAALQFQTQKEIADMESARRSATAISVAHIAANAKGAAIDAHAAEESLALGHEAMQAEHDRAHDVGLAAMQHDQALQQGQIGHAQGLEAGQVSHEQAMEQGDQGHQQALEQADQAAALAPQPEAEA